MSLYSTNNIFGLGTTQVVIPPGATVAVYVPQLAGAIWTRLEYSSGGSLELIGIKNPSATLTAAELVSAAGNHYVFRTSGNVDFLGGPAFYLAATGATTICHLIRGFSEGTS